MPKLWNDVKDKALDVWRRAPTLVVVTAIFLVTLCTTSCICGGCLSSFLGGGPRISTDKGGSEPARKAPATTPPRRGSK